MAGIFISYRREDNDVAAGRLADDLAEIFGSGAVFRDIGTIEAGENFTEALDRALDSCQVLLAIIGPRWATVTDDEGRLRLGVPGDWVSAEIQRALERGIRVIPILIGATMPRQGQLPPALHPLLQRQAIEISDRHWQRDLAALAEVLGRVPGISRKASPERESRFGWRTVLAALLAVVLLAGIGWLTWSKARPAAPAAAVDLSPWVRIRDSGPEGSVAGLAVVTAMEASLARQGRPVTLSARYLYEKAKTVDRFGQSGDGTDMSAAVYVAEAFGAPPEDKWPYIAGARNLPTGWTWAQMDEEAGKFRARIFRLSEIRQIAEQLERGHPVVASLQVSEDWMSDQTAKTGVIPSGTSASLAGGHAVVIVGFDSASGNLKFANSWGVGWGVNGFGEMPLTLAEQLKPDLWAIEVPPPEPK